MNKKEKAQEVWSRLFDFTVGDRVRVITIYSSLPEIRKQIGMTGRIRRIILDSWCDRPAKCKLPKVANCYIVHAEDGKEGRFRKEELELIG